MLEKNYEKVKGIVHRCRKDYYLHLWEKEDWDQEGLICLHELLEKHPELVEEEKKLYVYFKTKFRNRILDTVRKQESQKRRLDRMAYEEVGEISHRLPEGGLWLDDYYAFHDLLDNYRRKLPQDKQEAYERLWADERFKGRKSLLRELEEVFKEWRKKFEKGVDKYEKVGIIVRVENNNSGPLVKGLRHRLFTAVTRVRIPYGLSQKVVTFVATFFCMIKTLF